MTFCENCHIIADGQKCSKCGNKKLRDVNGEDFCLFINLDVFRFQIFEIALKENKIDVVGTPYYPSGVSRGNAGRASGRHVYIRYKNFGIARNIYQEIFDKTF